MKIPKENGFYRYYDRYSNRYIVVEYIDDRLFFTCNDNFYSPVFEVLNGSYFLKPIEPIKFD